MRTIKFRGKLEDSGNIVFFLLGEVELDEVGSNKFWLPACNDLVTDIEEFLGFDKNGREVYENDILVDDLGQEYTAEIFTKPNVIANLALKV